MNHMTGPQVRGMLSALEYRYERQVAAMDEAGGSSRPHDPRDIFGDNDTRPQREDESNLVFDEDMNPAILAMWGINVVPRAAAAPPPE